MKIDFIISSLGGGGAERVLTLMANKLSEYTKYDIRIITLLNDYEHYEVSAAVKRLTLKNNKRIPSHTVRSIINLISYYRKKSHRPDLIISLLTLNNFMCILVAKFYGIKIMIQEHNSYLRYMANRKRLSYFTRKALYRHADVLTVLTKFDIDYYKKYKVNVKVLPNPCTFKPIDNNSHTRGKTIIAVGHLNRWHHKGFDNLIRFITPILKEYPDWNLKIAGSGDEGLEYLTEIVEEHGISNRIIFTGFVNNISELLYESSIFILSSRYEGLPMVLLEAMSQGMACIAYDCKTGPSDIIEHNFNGLLIDDQDSVKMQEGLKQLIEDEKLRERLSNEGLKSLAKYDIDAIVERYEALFNEITAGHE